MHESPISLESLRRSRGTFADAVGLPPSVYADPDFYRFELEAVLALSGCVLDAASRFLMWAITSPLPVRVSRSSWYGSLIRRSALCRRCADTEACA